jgi:hypothetical protein
VKIALQHRSDRFGSGCGICICACSEFVEHTMMKRVRRFALLIDIKRIERCVLLSGGRHDDQFQTLGLAGIFHRLQ